MAVKEFFDEIDQARASWHDLYSILSSGGYDKTSPRAGIQNQSLEQLNLRAVLAFELLLSLNPKNDNSTSAATILSRADEVRAHLNSLKKNVAAAVTSLSPHLRDDSKIVDGNSNFALQVHSGGNVVLNWDGSAAFSQIHTATTGLLNFASYFLPLCKPEGIGDVGSRAKALGDVIHQAEQFKGSAKKFSEAANKSAASSEEQRKTIQQLQAQSEEHLRKLQALLQQATTDSGNVSALIEKIKATGAGAETLQQVIGSYQSKFDAFQRVLDERNALFSKFEIDTQTAGEINFKRDQEIERLLKLSDSMITGATTAGLAKSLEDARVRYYWRMSWARVGFLFSVAFLVVSAVPLAIDVLPNLFGQLAGTIEPNHNDNPYRVIGNILLLLPATWLTAFFTKSYSEFFDLERQYAHKAAVAMSVDGFKRQSQTYQEEIAVAVFWEILSNPAKDSVKPAAHPLYDLGAKLAEKISDKLTQLSKGSK